MLTSIPAAREPSPTSVQLLSHHSPRTSAGVVVRVGAWGTALAFETSLDSVHPRESPLSWVRIPTGGARDEDSFGGDFAEKLTIGQRGRGPGLGGPVRESYSDRLPGGKL